MVPEYLGVGRGGKAAVTNDIRVGQASKTFGGTSEGGEAASKPTVPKVKAG